MKALVRLAAFGTVVAAFASCSRANYTFSPAAPAYLGVERRFAEPAPAPQAHLSETALPGQQPIQGEARIQLTCQGSKTACSTLETAPAKAIIPARPARISLMRRLVVKHMAAQLRKVRAARQNTAQTQTEQEIPNAGRSGLLVLIGLILLIIALSSTAHTLDGAVVLLLLGITGSSLIAAGAVALIIELVSSL